MDFKNKDLFVVTHTSLKFLYILLCINSPFTQVQVTDGIGTEVPLNFKKAKPLLIYFLLTMFAECNAIILSQKCFTGTQCGVSIVSKIAKAAHSLVHSCFWTSWCTEGHEYTHHILLCLYQMMRCSFCWENCKEFMRQSPEQTYYLSMSVIQTVCVCQMCVLL